MRPTALGEDITCQDERERVEAATGVTLVNGPSLFLRLSGFQRPAKGQPNGKFTDSAFFFFFTLRLRLRLRPSGLQPKTLLTAEREIFTASIFTGMGLRLRGRTSASPAGAGAEQRADHSHL